MIFQSVLRALCILAVVPVVAARPAWPAPITPTAQSAAFQDASNALDRGEFDKAEAGFRALNQADPKAVSPYLGLAEVAARRGNTQAAIAALDAGIAAAPPTGELYFARARSYAQQRKGSEAVADYLKGLALDSEAVAPRVELADLLAQRLNDPERALTYYEEAVALDSTSAVARYGLAFGLARLNRTDEAIGTLREAQRLAPTNPMSTVAIGQIHAKTGKYDLALAEFADALKIKPGFLPALLGRADLLLTMRRPQEAVAAYQAALAADPKSETARLGLAMAQQAGGNNGEAERTYRSVLKANSKQALALNNLAALLAMRKDKLDEALGLARQAVAVAADLPEAHDTLGSVLQRRGDVEAAATEFEKSIALHPTATSYSHLGAVRTAMKQKDAAVVAFEEALRLEPNYAPAKDGLRVLGDAARRAN